MNHWYDRLHFLWEEEIASPEEVPRRDRSEPAGVPRPLRQATRFSLIGFVAISLMSQIVGVRLIAPVDAQPVYRHQCLAQCDTAGHHCYGNCGRQFGPDGKTPDSIKLDACVNQCTHGKTQCQQNCQQAD